MQRTWQNNMLYQGQDTTLCSYLLPHLYGGQPTRYVLAP